MLTILLLACTTDYVPPDPIFSIGPVDTDTGFHYADADVPLGIGFTLAADTQTFSGWETWPTLTATLSSGTWHGDGDATIEATISEPTTTLWVAPDPDAVSVDVFASLKIDGSVYREDTTIVLCPSEVGIVSLTSEAAYVEAGASVLVSATVLTPSGGRPTVGTPVTFSSTGGDPSVFERPEAVTDALGVATTRIRGATPALLEVHATATAVDRDDCDPGDPITSEPVYVEVTAAESETGGS
ncbi:MAG: hypothetical protein ACK4YP_01685 [Myxococcota bacterium]